MSDQDVFGTNEPKPAAPAAPDTNPFADQLKEIVSSDGVPKYDSVDKALEALKHSQEHIARLEKENQERDAQYLATKDELSKMKTIEEFAGSLKTPDPAPKTPDVTPDGDGKGLDPAAIEKLLEQKLSDRDAKATRANNLNAVVSALKGIHGDKTSEHIRKVADELGTTSEKLQELSQENPKLALSLMGQTSPKVNTAPTTSSISAPQPNTQDNPQPTWDKGAARGGMTDRQLADRWKEVAAYTHKRIGVQT